jgi:hypothetical protein
MEQQMTLPPMTVHFCNLNHHHGRVEDDRFIFEQQRKEAGRILIQHTNKQQ